MSTILQGMAFTSLNRPGSPVDSEEKYPALRIVLFILKGFVVLFALIAIGVAVYAWRQPDRNSVPIGLLILLGGAIGCLFQWANIELIEVFLDIEENTRRTADRGSS